MRRASQLSEGERAEIISAADAWSDRHHREAIPEQVRFGLEQSIGLLHLIGRGAQGELLYVQGHPREGAIEFSTFGGGVSAEQLAAIEGVCAEQQKTPLLWQRGGAEVAAGVHQGFEVSREIIRMKARLTGTGPPTVPAGVFVRTFRPGRDEATWLDLNARSFPEHPDQGRVSAEDLEERKRATWFRSDGFFIVNVGDTPAASCWMKIHEDPWGATGEIYAIGVDPDFIGTGLGRMAALIGLNWLREQALDSAILFVESDNDAALNLYRSLGFEEEWRDTVWSPKP